MANNQNKKSDDGIGLMVLCALSAGILAAHAEYMARFFVTAILVVIAMRQK